MRKIICLLLSLLLMGCTSQVEQNCPVIEYETGDREVAVEYVKNLKEYIHQESEKVETTIVAEYAYTFEDGNYSDFTMYEDADGYLAMIRIAVNLEDMETVLRDYLAVTLVGEMTGTDFVLYIVNNEDTSQTEIYKYDKETNKYKILNAGIEKFNELPEETEELMESAYDEAINIISKLMEVDGYKEFFPILEETAD